MVRKLLQIKLSGRALYLAIIISFLSILMAFTFILSRYYGYVEYTLIMKAALLRDNVNSALNVLIQSPDFIENGEYSELLLFDGEQTCKIRTQRWGLLGIAEAESSWKQYNEKKIALFGHANRPESFPGLYLADHGHYLALAGDSYLSGECYLPKLGARKAYIDGESFKYNSILNGSQRISRGNLPAIDPEFVQYFKQGLMSGNSNHDSLVDISFLNNGLVSNSYSNKTIRIYDDKLLRLSNMEISGNFIVQSAVKIKINSSALLRNIICIAPEIEVESGFRGKLQLFATDTIRLNNNLHLEYPSTVMLMSIASSNGIVSIGENSRVDGTVVAYSEISLDNQILIRIDKNADIYGLVYSSGKVEHKGKVHGSLYCDKFVLRTRQGYYENHLLNAWVDPLSLDPSFARGMIFSRPDKNNSKIIECLN